MHFTYDLLPVAERKQKPAPGQSLGFGKLRTDHMFLMEYSGGEWHDARIVPYGPISLVPGSMCFHYGQTIFEGIKAFRHPDGEIYTFRSDLNAERTNRTTETMCMAPIPVELQEEALMRLIDVERDWCPAQPESSLYIRPFMFATQDNLGVKASNEYIYCIILSPSGPYYEKGISQAIRLLITTKFHRAAPGGTGSAKCGGNYAASMKAAEFAHEHGAEQVLYLSADNKRVEEAGAMNHYHVLADGTFIIPEFGDTILRSITSVSVLDLAAAGQVKARQEVVLLDDFLAGIKSGAIIEAGGFGTAAVVSPVGEYIMDDGSSLTVGNGKVGKHSLALYDLYSSMQTGRKPAPEGWLRKVPRF